MPSFRRSAFALLVVVGIGLPGGIGSASPAADQSAQQPSFRAGVELVLADVQVVDRDGYPVAGLTPDQFQVAIAGKRQKVVSADLVQFDGRATRDGRSVPRDRAPAASGSATSEERLFLLVIDTLSFPPTVSQGVMVAARAFISRLQPTDRVGLYTYPIGPKVFPTTDHTTVSLELAKVLGARAFGASSRFQVRASEIVDLAMAMRTQVPDRSADHVLDRECDGVPGQPETRERGCVEALRLEVQSTVSFLESIAHQSIGGLREIVQSFEQIPGRKTAVLLTSGMLVSDRPGGRPDVGNLSLLAGQDAARANVTAYTLFIDSRYLERNSAEARRGNANNFTTLLRDTDTMSRWFDEFAGATGGTLFTDLLGRGEIGFDRIIRETSAYYRLGIDPESVERTGRPQRMEIKVEAPNTTVRGRTWVVVPLRSN
jgi:VWFA-related protein